MPNLKKGNNERKGKGLATNVVDITLVLVPRAPKEWINGMKNPRSGIIKRAKAPAKRHSTKKHLIH